MFDVEAGARAVRVRSNGRGGSKELVILAEDGHGLKLVVTPAPGNVFSDLFRMASDRMLTLTGA